MAWCGLGRADLVGERAEHITHVEKERKRENAPAKKAYGQFQNVFLEDEEYAALVEQFTQADEIIEQFSRKLKAKNYKYESHYAAILFWQAEDEKKKNESKPEIERSFDVNDFFNAALQRSYNEN